MRNISIISLVTLVSVISLTSKVSAEDSTLSVDMPRNAKIGHTEMRMEIERLADGDTWESIITCVKVSQKITKCISTDDLGWAETMICRGTKCQIVASR